MHSYGVGCNFDSGVILGLRTSTEKKNKKNKKKTKKNSNNHNKNSVNLGHSCSGSAVTNLTSICEDEGLIPGLAQWAKDLALLWLWCRPAAVALIRPLDWELPYATHVALKKQQKKTNKNKRKKKQEFLSWFSG